MKVAIDSRPEKASLEPYTTDSGGNGYGDPEDPLVEAEPPELLAELAEIRQLLERGAIRAAEQLARGLPLKWPESRRAARVASILAPPRFQVLPVSENERDRDQEFVWLRAHAAEYAGNWLAVLEGRLLAVAPELKTVLQQLEQVPDGDKALLHLSPKGMPWP